MARRVALLVFLLVSSLLFGGDIATFANLGFSANSRYFMFAQYGVGEEDSYPYADLFVVDVPANDFVPDGVRQEVYAAPSEPGFIGAAALYTLLAENADLKKEHGIDHLATGRILYLLVDGDEPKEELDFRDFLSGIRYNVSLEQKVYGEGEGVRSSFHIDLTVIAQNGTSRYYRVGLPNFQRTGVKGYRIKQVILSPGGSALVFVIEKEEVDRRGSNIRYMVETVIVG